VTRLLVARLAQGIAVVALVASAVFVLVRLAPGDPFAQALDDASVDPAVRARWRAAYGFDAPIATQYVRWLGALLRGDLGWSTSRHAPVATVIVDALPWTLALAGTATVLAFAIGMATGAWQARHRDGPGDRTATTLAVGTAALPDFWLALVLLLAFTGWWRLFPVGGASDPLLAADAPLATRALDLLRHLALPLAALTLVMVGTVAQLQRASILDQATADWARTAHAKGVAPDRVWRAHVWRTALVPMTTLAGLALPALLGAGVFVEHVFAWPGFGGLAAGAIAARDYHLVTGCTLVATVLVVIGGWLADAASAWLDPRLRTDAPGLRA
jgi:peptide/nickel transport system permease protein